jgi:hypothetical protein
MKKGITIVLAITAIMLLAVTSCRQREQKEEIVTYLTADDVENPYNVDSVMEAGNWYELPDSTAIGFYFRMGDSIYCALTSVPHQIFAMKGVDVATFKVNSVSDYAKDANHVYYPMDITYYDAYDWYADIAGRYVVEDADVASFKYIGADLAMDRKHLYHSGDLIDWDNEQIQYAIDNASKDTVNNPKRLE